MSFLLPELVTPDTVTLERVKVAAQVHLPCFVASHLELEAMRDLATENLVLKLKSFVLAEKRREEVREDFVSVPASPWQHAKERWAPQWFLDRWPVRYTTYTLRVKVEHLDVYPDAEVRLPPDKFGRPVRIARLTRLLPDDHDYGP